MKITDPEGAFILIHRFPPINMVTVGSDVETFARPIDLAKTAIDLALSSYLGKGDLLHFEEELMRHIADRTEALVGEPPSKGIAP